MKIESLMPLAFGTLMLGILMAACCIAAAQPQDLSSKMADRADLADMDLTQYESERRAPQSIEPIRLKSLRFQSKWRFYALCMAFKFPASRNKDGKD